MKNCSFQRPLALLLALALALTFACVIGTTPVLAAQDSGSTFSTVTVAITIDENPAPEGVRLTLQDVQNTTGPVTAETDASGNAIFNNTVPRLSDFKVLINEQYVCDIGLDAAANDVSSTLEVFLATLNLDGGSFDGPNPMYTSGFIPFDVIPQKKGFFFIYWSGDGEMTFHAYSPNQTAHAKWMPQLVTKLSLSGTEGEFGMPFIDRRDHLGEKSQQIMPVKVILPQGSSLHTAELDFEIAPEQTLYLRTAAGTNETVSPKDVFDFSTPLVFYTVKEYLPFGNDYPLEIYQYYEVTATVQKAEGSGSSSDSSPDTSRRLISRAMVLATSEGAGGINPIGTNYYTPGSSPKYTLTPDSGAQLIDLLVDGKSVGTPENYTFTEIQGSHKIHAIFSDITPQKINPNTGGGWLSRLWYDLRH